MLSERLERTENMSIQDIALAKALGMSENEVIELDLFRIKNGLQNYGWKLEGENKKITQEEADMLNKKFEDTMVELNSISHIDFSADYWIDFNNYVDDGKPKHFSYIPCEGYTSTLK